MPSSSSLTTEETAGSSTRRLTVTIGSPSAANREIAAILALDARQDQPVDAAGAEHRGDLRLAVEVTVGVGEDGEIAAAGERILDAADDRREHRIGDVGDDDADGPGAVGPQRGGGGIGPIVESRAHALDRRRHFGRDEMAGPRVERAGHGRDVDARLLRDILQGGTPSHRNQIARVLQCCRPSTTYRH